MKYNKELLNRFLTEKVAIAVRTQEEWDEFMELLEKETDLTWKSGKKPTEFDGWEKYKEEIAIANYFKHRGLAYSDIYFFIGEGYEIIEFKELVKEREMNLAEKLRFLADRWEDGKDFYIGTIKYSLNKGGLVMLPSGIQSENRINDLRGINLKLAPQWTFTEDEKAILRNLPKEYEWIARDRNGRLYFFNAKPTKMTNFWFRITDKSMATATYVPFGHLFKSIQWADEEPCEFRKYL